MLTDLHRKWSNVNRITTILRDEYKEETEEIFASSKQMMKSETAPTNKIYSKLFMYTKLKMAPTLVVCLGSAPSHITQKIVNFSNTSTAAIQTNTKHFSNLAKRQKELYRETLESNKTSIIDMNSNGCVGDLMNLGCVHNTINSAVEQGPGGNPSLLICDSGTKKLMISNKEFDGYLVAENILMNPHIGNFDIVIIKIQNALESTNESDSVDFVDHVECLIRFSRENGHNCRFVKPTGSWAMNGELYFMMYIQTSIDNDNPLQIDVNAIFELSLAMSNMIAQHEHLHNMLKHKYDIECETTKMTEDTAEKVANFVIDNSIWGNDDKKEKCCNNNCAFTGDIPWKMPMSEDEVESEESM